MNGWMGFMFVFEIDKHCARERKNIKSILGGSRIFLRRGAPLRNDVTGR